MAKKSPFSFGTFLGACPDFSSGAKQKDSVLKAKSF